ncbi:MAG: hypothetical protein KA419_14460 [Acidobacteria bacterium]|nr:hypothetical protein [Acidobacteriota bacterium]
MSGLALTLMILFVVIIGIVVVLLAWLLRDAVKKEVPVDAGLAAQLNVDDPEGFNAGRPAIRTIGDRQCVLRHIQGNKNHPSGVSFTFPDILLPRLTVIREQSVQKFFKKIGLTAELATGDPRFDDLFFLLTDETVYYRDYFSDTRRRETVRAIFTADPGVVKIQATSAGLSVISHARTTPSGVVLPTLSPEAMTKLVSDLDAGPGWQSSHVEPLHAGNRPLAGMLPRVAALAALTGLVLVLGVIMLAAGSVMYRLLDFDFLSEFVLYSLLALCVFWMLLFKGLRGHAWSHLAFLPMALVSLLAFPLAGMGGSVFLNGYLDPSPPVKRHATVLNKSIRTNKSSRTYYVTFSDWRPGRSELTFSVSKYFHDSVKAGDPLDVITHPGYLGQEWVASISAAGVFPE